MKSITSEPIKIVYDAISLKETQEASYPVLSPGGEFITVLPFLIDESAIDDSKSLAKVFGRADDADDVFEHLTALLESGEIKASTSTSCLATS